MEILEEKCRFKGVPVPTLASINASPRREELESEWEHMLAHQLPQLPPLDVFLAELSERFVWLEGRKVEAPPLPAFPVSAEVQPTWASPPTVSTWGVGVPLEAIRFAGANRLCKEPFTPIYPVEFWPTGPMSAPPVLRRASLTGRDRPRKVSGFRVRYVVQRHYCGKRFTRQDTKLRKHNMKGQRHFDCPGRVGFIVRMK